MIEAQQQKLHHEASIIDTSGIAVEMILRQSSFAVQGLSHFERGRRGNRDLHFLAGNHLFVIFFFLHSLLMLGFKFLATWIHRHFYCTSGTR
jgi:hypothetical protein